MSANLLLGGCHYSSQRFLSNFSARVGSRRFFSDGGYHWQRLSTRSCRGHSDLSTGGFGGRRSSFSDKGAPPLLSVLLAGLILLLLLSLSSLLFFVVAQSPCSSSCVASFITQMTPLVSSEILPLDMSFHFLQSLSYLINKGLLRPLHA